jgi:hypothetical protein
MTKLEIPTPVSELHRHQLVRKKDGPIHFALSHAAIDLAIKEKKLPPTFAVLEGGRAQAWTLGQILDYHAERQAAVVKPSPPQPAGLAKHQLKIKKLKLRPPAKQRESA